MDWLLFAVLSVIAAPIILMGVRFLRRGLECLRRGKSSQSWPQAPGHVTSSEIVHRSDSADAPKVVYTYAVNGQSFTSDRIAFRDLGKGFKFQVQPFVEKYAAGRDIMVFYDPNDPATSVLEPGSDGASFNLIIAAVLLVIVPALMVLAALNAPT